MSAADDRWLSKLTDPRWYWVLAPAALVTFVIGCWGYLSYEEGGHSLTDAVYGSVKLFFLHAAPQPESHVGIALNIARFVGPVIAGWAALIALVSLFWDRVQQLLIPLKRGHVVVCGLGYVGLEFVRQLHDAGYRAVVVEADENNPHIAMCRGWGYPVIVGDAQLASTLDAAGVRKAARLLAVTPDSVVNTEIVARGRAQAGRGSERPVLRCLARVDDPGLCLLLRIAEANHGDDDSSLDFFSTDEIGARLLFEHHPADFSGAPHIVVAHPDSLGAGLIFHAARKWHDERTDDSIRLLVTVIDDRPDERVAALLDRYPTVQQVCDFRCYRATVRDLDRLAAERADLPAISQIYVTADRDERTVATALAVRQVLSAHTPLVAAVSRAYAVGDLLADKRTPGSMTVDVFRTLQETCTVELIEGGSFEAVAQEIYRRYRLMQSAADLSAPPWSGLDEAGRVASRAQARHVGVKLRSVGCEIAPLRDWCAKEFTFDPDELHSLTVMEHDRWWREKEAAGWTLGPKDDKRKTHPDLVPWEQLPDDVADWDRQFVVAIPEMLAAVGLQIVDVRGTSRRTTAVGS
ncbi:NAD-binding protein [Mycobacterium sp. M1]|uniref:NAD-binding protein n=1 Tax=Mycolicibacter acidiphilus TaxID=2835306 RepID=A0ABS5RIE6_9MYCO|nr:NAD-binding protein [Mycolicibacter acidiphilus]